VTRFLAGLTWLDWCCVAALTFALAVLLIAFLWESPNRHNKNRRP
jgi:hypothetical protein